MNLNIIIKDLLKEHPEGGEKFFDALDLLIRGDSDILSMFLDFVMNNLSENITYGVVLSGKFGCVLYNNYGHILSKYFDGGIILTNGGIRKGEPAYLGVTELSCTNYVFLDDSYYSGKTKSGIEEALKIQIVRLKLLIHLQYMMEELNLIKLFIVYSDIIIMHMI